MDKLTPHQRQAMTRAAQRNNGKLVAATRTINVLWKRGLTTPPTFGGTRPYAMLTPAGYDAIGHAGPRYSHHKGDEGRQL